MKAPRITLKKVKTFQGHEGMGLNCDLYINGTFCMSVIDDGNGGQSTFYEERTPKAKELIAQWDAYIKTMPPMIWKAPNGNEHSLSMDRDLVINNILEQKEIEKFNKKRKRLYSKAIVFGEPNGNSYRHLNFKKPLSEIPKAILQKYVDDTKQKYCTNGEVILNTNLTAMGINI